MIYVGEVMDVGPFRGLSIETKEAHFYKDHKNHCIEDCANSRKRRVYGDEIPLINNRQKFALKIGLIKCKSLKK